MSIFGKSKEDPQTVEIKGKALRCPICKNEQFRKKKVLLNTVVLTFLDLDWANRKAACFICSLLFFLAVGYGQPAPEISGKSIPQLRRMDGETSALRERQAKAVKFFKSETWPLLRLPEQEEAAPFALRRQPSVYQYDRLGFFCKMEVQLERSVKFPVKFRLGTVQYVESLEGKYDYALYRLQHQ